LHRHRVMLGQDIFLWSFCSWELQLNFFVSIQQNRHITWMCLQSPSIIHDQWSIIIN
jgi:hypothetical protein